MESVHNHRKLTPEERREKLREEMWRELRKMELERRQRVAMEEFERSNKEKEKREKEIVEEKRRQDLKAREREQGKRRADEQKALKLQKEEQAKKDKLLWRKVMMVGDEPVPSPRYTLSSLKREQQRRREEAKFRLSSEAKKRQKQGRRKTLINNWVGEQIMAHPPSAEHTTLKPKTKPKSSGLGSDKNQAQMEKTEFYRLFSRLPQQLVYSMSRNQILQKSLKRTQKDGSSMVDQMTRLRLKLLEKRLQNEKHNMDDRAESSQSARSYDGRMDALHRELRRKQDLLQRLREQHMFEDLNRPHTWAGSRRQYQSHFVTAPQPPAPHPSMVPTYSHHPAPALPFLPPPPPAVPQHPSIIQQTLPQQPATIIQQLPPQQPLIAQIPPPQPYPAPRSGSIKEDMVELMLMQNAQMHQIIMHNMMLKAMPPMALSPPSGPSRCATHLGQDSHRGNPIFVRPDIKPRGNAVHHHHHYGPTPAAPQLPPVGYSTWLPGVSSVPAAQAGGHLPSLYHVPAPVTLPPLNATQVSL